MKRFITIVLLTFFISLLVGCQQNGAIVEDIADVEIQQSEIDNQQEQINAEEQNDVIEEQGGMSTVPEAEQQAEAEQELDYYPVKIVVLNFTGVDIGMFSIIDPSTKEQLQISGLEKDCAITMDINWPNEETMLDWALYNKLGELCVEGSSDLTGMTESATLTFSGDNNVDDINIDIK